MEEIYHIEFKDNVFELCCIDISRFLAYYVCCLSQFAIRYLSGAKNRTRSGGVESRNSVYVLCRPLRKVVRAGKAQLYDERFISTNYELGTFENSPFKDFWPQTIHAAVERKPYVMTARPLPSAPPNIYIQEQKQRQDSALIPVSFIYFEFLSW